ncbi:MAG: hypothetical protein K8H86_02235 [Ignavibacteriaceae bacterium]|nr:hypothetical protein [Ignavibacteriaceae bacterium]
MEVKLNNIRSMNDESSKNDNHIDTRDFLIIEYPDYFEVSPDKKVKCKNLGNKFASLSTFFFDYLKEYHIPSAFFKNHEGNKLKFLNYERFPFQVKVLNTVDKRTSKIFSRKEGEHLNLPILEYHMGSCKDTLISESHVVSFDICSSEDLKLISRICSKVNVVLKSFFERRNFFLAEFCCHFGVMDDKIYLVDDFSPKSIKIIPFDTEGKWLNPYKLTTSSEIKNYTDELMNLISA